MILIFFVHLNIANIVFFITVPVVSLFSIKQLVQSYSTIIELCTTSGPCSESVCIKQDEPVFCSSQPINLLDGFCFLFGGK